MMRFIHRCVAYGRLKCLNDFRRVLSTHNSPVCLLSSRWRVGAARRRQTALLLAAERQQWTCRRLNTDTDTESGITETDDWSTSADHDQSDDVDRLVHSRLHTPVMAKDVVSVIAPTKGQVIVDMTFGAGGHTRCLLNECPDITIYALDRDPMAFSIAQQLSKTHGQVVPLLGRFSDIHRLLSDRENQVDAVLFDVGMSSMQADSTERGFSCSHDAPLDMRLDGNRVSEQLTASDVVNHMSVEGLYDVIRVYGEDKQAKMIAHAIVDARYTHGPIMTTRQLADIVNSVFHGQAPRRDKLGRPVHFATKTFQALRTFVNNELNELHGGLQAAHRLLKARVGVCVAVCFHSLEDRIVKREFHAIDMDEKLNMSVTDRLRDGSVIHSQDYMRQIMAQRWQPVTRGIITPSQHEISRNPRARSAKLRAAWKL